MKLFLLYLISINTISFVLFSYDKFLAIKNKRRISEKELFTVATIGGTLGGILSMYLFKHKTNKFSFIIIFYTITILQIVLLYFGIQAFKS
jgi:uncharacterized membrane protein YsdA (DUF1294 family)